MLEGLSCQDLQKFGTLLSAVITKSWPVHNGEPVFDVEEIFKYLLKWPDVRQLFELCGMFWCLWGAWGGWCPGLDISAAMC